MRKINTVREMAQQNHYHVEINTLFQPVKRPILSLGKEQAFDFINRLESILGIEIGTDFVGI